MIGPVSHPKPGFYQRWRPPLINQPYILRPNSTRNAGAHIRFFGPRASFHCSVSRFQPAVPGSTRNILTYHRAPPAAVAPDTNRDPSKSFRQRNITPSPPFHAYPSSKPKNSQHPQTKVRRQLRYQQRGSFCHHPAQVAGPVRSALYFMPNNVVGGRLNEVGAGGDGHHNLAPRNAPTLSNDCAACQSLAVDSLANKLIGLLDESLIDEISKEYNNLNGNKESDAVNQPKRAIDEPVLAPQPSKPAATDEPVLVPASDASVTNNDENKLCAKILATLPLGNGYDSELYLVQTQNDDDQVVSDALTTASEKNIPADTVPYESVVDKKTLGLLCDDRRIKGCTLECKDGQWSMHLDLDETNNELYS
ncbi:uncharacterized protein LOC141900991 isoform X1 [Tubulanus polymorphus]|uniref:uncharacterized protein LOC141900991 isoform X1 n=1 Tax=Tubulanus polymorphus TaxID=672921 RepID=UPI003DA3F009